MPTARPYIMPLPQDELLNNGCNDKDRRIHYAEREERTMSVGAGILKSEANKKSPRTLFRPAGNIARSAPAECGKRAGKGVCS